VSEPPVVADLHCCNWRHGVQRYRLWVIFLLRSRAAISAMTLPRGRGDCQRLADGCKRAALCNVRIGCAATASHRRPHPLLSEAVKMAHNSKHFAVPHRNLDLSKNDLEARFAASAGALHEATVDAEHHLRCWHSGRRGILDLGAQSLDRSSPSDCGSWRDCSTSPPAGTCSGSRRLDDTAGQRQARSEAQATPAELCQGRELRRARRVGDRRRIGSAHSVVYRRGDVQRLCRSPAAGGP
jgi:hypothetical protein